MSSSVLLRTSALIAGAAALTGCSSDSQRFQSLFASVQPQYVQPVSPTTTASIQNQNLPVGVDASISTGSIGRRGQAAVAGVPRPVGAVGQMMVPVSQQQPAYRPLAPALPSQPAPQMATIAPVASPVLLRARPCWRLLRPRKLR
ncbi:MAG: hypothetical protein HC779_06665 [Phyllobacteriaceae bacterium]|nr:hypothetical protein [Phyllobacteriaceae bacterium]